MMKRLAVFIVAGLFVSGLAAVGAQTSAATVFSGCAMPLENNQNFLTLCEPHNCSLLRGKVEPSLAGHAVTLRGVLHAATSTQPRTIEVEAVVKVGDACKAACQPAISGRGLKDKPQGEGGTPGEAPQTPKPPTQ